VTATDIAVPSFGDDGIAVEGGGGTAWAVAVQGDGKVLVGGRSAGAAGVQYDFKLVRFTEDGQLDVAFGDGGVVMSDFRGATSDRILVGLQVQADGRILASGTSADQWGHVMPAMARRVLRCHAFTPAPQRLGG
jgi:uncharacterized delta-60 repeat protein